MTTITNEDIFVVINVSGWYNLLQSGPGGSAGPNSSYGAGYGGGGGAGCAISQMIYLGAGTILWAVSLQSGSANPSAIMLLQNNTYSCYANELYYIIGISSSPSPNYEYAYSNTTFTYNGSTIPAGNYPANTAVAGIAGAGASSGYGGNGGSGGNGGQNSSGQNGGQVTPTYTWYGMSSPEDPDPSNPFYETTEYFPTGVGGGGGNGGNYNSSGEYNGHPGWSYTPATPAGTGGSNSDSPPGYVNFTCADGLTVVINKGGYQNEAADSPFFMIYYTTS